MAVEVNKLQLSYLPPKLIYEHCSAHGHIWTYQENHSFFMTEQDRAENKNEIVVNGAKFWKGKVNIVIHFDDSSKFFTGNDFKSIGIDDPLKCFDIGKFFDGFQGNAFIESITKAVPVVIVFQGSGILFKDGEDI